MIATAKDPAGRRTAASDYVINVRGLTKHFPIREGVLQRVTGRVRAVDGVSFDVRRGETLGLVGESGCGKTTLGRCVSGLVSPSAGGVYFGMRDDDLRRLDALRAVPPEQRTSEQRRELDEVDAGHRVDAMPPSLRHVYRRNCQVVFQDAFASLNPRHLVWDVVGRPLRIHREASGGELTERVVDLLEAVGLGRQHLYRFPHQFSGGQRQRISIARALALDPDFVVLDEPTSALDVSVQAQILNLLHELQRDRGLTYLFISHDLNVVRHMSDRIVVMYLGRVAEEGAADLLFEDPRHPYTEALLSANHSLDGSDRPLIRLHGAVPDPANPPQGCRFHTRCPVATPACGWEVDDLVRELERRPELGSGLTDVTRDSPVEGELAFESEAQAEALASSLHGERGSSAMAGALLEVRATGRVLRVRFREADDVPLEHLGGGRRTACLLHRPPPP